MESCIYICHFLELSVILSPASSHLNFSLNFSRWDIPYQHLSSTDFSRDWCHWYLLCQQLCPTGHSQLSTITEGAFSTMFLCSNYVEVSQPVHLTLSGWSIPRCSHSTEALCTHFLTADMLITLRKHDMNLCKNCSDDIFICGESFTF